MAHLETSETVKKLAEASGWTIAESRIPTIAATYNAILEDTHLLRQADLQDSVPSTIFEAE